MGGLIWGAWYGGPGIVGNVPNPAQINMADEGGNQRRPAEDVLQLLAQQIFQPVSTEVFLSVLARHSDTNSGFDYPE